MCDGKAVYPIIFPTTRKVKAVCVKRKKGYDDFAPPSIALKFLSRCKKVLHLCSYMKHESNDERVLLRTLTRAQSICLHHSISDILILRSSGNSRRL